MWGVRNIVIQRGHLSLGTSFFPFADNRTRGVIRVEGKLVVDEHVSIGSGSRWHVGPDSLVKIGAYTYFSPDTLLISSTAVEVGVGCAISWQTQILDDDFHDLEDDSTARKRTAAVTIGDHVWIGTRCLLLKGSRVADGCVVGAGSVVLGAFDEPNCLIAGSPARVVRRGVFRRS